MVSEHGYTTVALLESYAGLDYSVIASKYTDGVIDAQITQAEYIVNSLADDDFTGAVPDAAKASTLEIAKRLMHNILVLDGYAVDKVTIVDAFVIDLIKLIIKPEENTHDIKIITDVTSGFFDIT